MWGWLIATRLGRGVGLAVAAAVAILGAFLMGRREGAQNARAKGREADQKNANEIEERADEALRRLDGDTRDVDERLRGRGRIRDRD